MSNKSQEAMLNRVRNKPSLAARAMLGGMSVPGQTNTDAPNEDTQNKHHNDASNVHIESTIPVHPSDENIQNTHPTHTSGSDVSVTQPPVITERNFEMSQLTATELFEQKRQAKSEPSKSRVTFLVDNDLAAQLDQLCKEKGYGFKSEFINLAIANQLALENSKRRK